MKILKKLAITSVVVVAMFAGVGVIGSIATPAYANDLTITDVVDGGSGTGYRGRGQPAELFGGQDAIIPRVINLMLFIVGILAIVMLIYGGIRYVISGGQHERVTAAKNTILYAIVGLIVAIMGYAVVNWVVRNLGEGSGSGTI